jgi:NUMOD4 motif
MTQERWVPIAGFHGYEVSDQGRVRSFLTTLGHEGPLRKEPHLLKTRVKKGREMVTLSSKYGKLQRHIPDLVRAAFGPPA